MILQPPPMRSFAVISLAAVLLLAASAHGQAAKQTPAPSPARTPPPAAAQAAPPAAPVKGAILEDVVARVNNDVITRSDLDHAAKQLHDEVQQDCGTTCTAAEVSEKLADGQKNLLRDLIDNSLLVQRAKDADINVDAQVVKRLDQIRIENHIASMEDLEKRVNESGQDYEDFKNNIKNQLLTQEVIRHEIGARIIIDHAQVSKYYEDHKSEFVRPETVVLSEMFVSTQGKTDAQAADLRKKADGLLQRVKDGEDFGELAKRFSDGSTAAQGGDLGTFERDQMAANLADAVFKLQRNGVTDVMVTKNGFLILQVREHYAAGQQPEEKVEEEISSRLYNEQMKPALRDYLVTLRQDSYVEVKPGYVDTGASEGGESSIQETTPTPDNDVAKKSHKLFGRGKNSGT